MSKGFPVLISFTGLTNFLGVVGVIGSLIFVGLELRQSQKIALAAQQQNRMSVFIDIINTATEAGLEYSASYPESAFVQRNFMHASFFILENDVVQYNLGLMEDSIWEAKRNALLGMMAGCVARDVFSLRRTQLDRRLVELVDAAIVGECIATDDSSMVNPLENVEIFDNYRQALKEK